jgi:hypothetical protein
MSFDFPFDFERLSEYGNFVITLIYLTPQALPKYIYLSPPLIFPTTSTELGQKTARCESLRALLHYVEWDRIVTLTGAQAD